MKIQNTKGIEKTWYRNARNVTFDTENHFNGQKICGILWGKKIKIIIDMSFDKTLSTCI